MALSEDTMFWSQNVPSPGSGSGSSSRSGSVSAVFLQRLGSSGRRQVYSGRSVRGVWSLDSRQQRYPSDKCLLPGPPAGRPSDIYSRSSSVGLQMSPRSPPAECGGVSAAAIRYTLHYGPTTATHRCRDHLQYCQNKVSNDLTWCNTKILIQIVPISQKISFHSSSDLSSLPSCLVFRRSWGIGPT